MTDREALAKEALQDGKEAARQGVKLTDCPHALGTLQQQWWAYGWRRAISERAMKGAA